LNLDARQLRQWSEERGHDKLHSLLVPEVECISKCKAQARFPFGVTVSLATTNAAACGGQFALGARALPGKPQQRPHVCRPDQPDRTYHRRSDRA
jgi:IS5 family transposase